jgi:hypothetical protein
MGTYYAVFNLTKKEWYSGHEMDQGAKWFETLHGAPAAALVVLLAGPSSASTPWRGRWVADRIVCLPDWSSSWREVIDDFLGASPVDDNEMPPGWVNVGAELERYLVEQGELPCGTPTPGESSDGETYCAHCRWPLSHHGMLVGVVVRAALAPAKEPK